MIDPFVLKLVVKAVAALLTLVFAMLALSLAISGRRIAHRGKPSRGLLAKKRRRARLMLLCGLAAVGLLLLMRNLPIFAVQPVSPLLLGVHLLFAVPAFAAFAVQTFWLSGDQYPSIHRFLGRAALVAIGVALPTGFWMMYLM